MEPKPDKTLETPRPVQAEPGVATQDQGAAAQGAKPKVEYRMIAFSLAGRDYGIDIMKVKEISHEGKFTYVPNTAPYVLGVHNLRGEIIPIIDLRRMFNLAVPEGKAGAEQNILILKLEKLILGVVVDSIDGVTSVDRDSIQPPHPIFSDINIRYISGVVEKEEALYVILDVESIFTEAAPAPAASAVRLSKPIEPQVKTSDQDLKFVCEGLASLVSFYVTPANEAWVRKRFAAWKKNRDKLGISVQLRGPEDAGEFLSGFASTDSGNLWGDAQRAALIDLLLPHPSGTFVVWNYGCGRGFDAYSAVCTLKSAFPALAVKAWANDDNLVEIATAPSLMLPKELVPAFYASSSFLRGTDAGFQFTPAVRESIIFEYTESLSRMEIIQADLIICRDVVSYLPPDAQKTLLEAFAERLTPDGRLILGTNELAAGAGWKATEKGGARAFVRESPKE